MQLNRNSYRNKIKSIYNREQEKKPKPNNNNNENIHSVPIIKLLQLSNSQREKSVDILNIGQITSI